MEFKPNLKIGNEYTNADIVKTFICGNMGGMRRSKKTNTLVIISDDTKAYTVMFGRMAFYIILEWAKREIRF